MSVEQLLAPRSFAFGSLEDGLWGICWLSLPHEDGRDWPPGGDGHRLALGAGPDAATVEVSISGAGPGDPWQVVGDGTELTLTPAAPPPPHASLGTAAEVDQICRVEGTVAFGPTSRSVACLGWRGSGGPVDEAGRVQSFRQVAAWFGPGEGLALLAVRPRSAKGHDQDRVSAAALDPERPLVVAEPRLSTTYDASGRPLRAGLELWLGAAPHPDGAVQEQQHSRRAAGEALPGATVTWAAGTVELQARRFRWHSVGRDGAGVYVSGTLR